MNLFDQIEMELKIKQQISSLTVDSKVLSVEGKIGNQEHLLTIQLIKGFQGESELIILAQNVEERRKLIRMKERALEQASALAEMKTHFINTLSSAQDL